jgi:gas vesicle protein
VTYFLIGLQIGGAVGFLLAACMGAAKRDDESIRSEANFLRAQRADATREHHSFGSQKR